MNTIKISTKILLSLLLLIFFGCDNMIDAPNIPSGKVDDGIYTFSESFNSGIGSFTQRSDSGMEQWTFSKNKYVYISGNKSNVAYANEDWLISPQITLPELVTSVFNFDYVTRGFDQISVGATIWVSENYNPDSLVKKATWIQLNPVEPFKNLPDWNMANTGDISLKAYKGKKVNIALKYTSTNADAGTWQVKNFIVKDRKPVSLPYSEPFSTAKGKFVAINVFGDQVWSIDRSYIKMSGFVGSSNLANEDWLISPQIDLSKVTTAKMSFDHVTRYFTNPKSEASIWVSRDYEEGMPADATWTLLKTPLPFSNGGSWDFTKSGEINLSEYAGDTITIALKYLSTAGKAGTWEVKNFLVQEGAPTDFIFVEAFDEGLGLFTTESKLGAQSWYVNTANKYAVMSGFANSKSNENEDWLISPSIDLTGKGSAKICFDHTINKGLPANKESNHTLWISADNGVTWEQLVITNYPVGSNWTFVNSGDLIIPEKFLGINTFKFAFKYLCSNTESASWEIKNVIIK